MIEKTPLLALILCSSLFIVFSVIARPQVIFSVTHEPYTVTLSPTRDTAYVDVPYFIHLNLYPKTLPPGYTVSTLVDLLESPAGRKPQILPGFPAIQLKMMQAGTYIMKIRLALISKSSCAGVDAERIFEKDFILEVTER